MGLNIKNERTHALVRELADLTGASQTSAVEDAVRRRIEQVRSVDGVHDGTVAEVLRIATDFQHLLTDEQRLALADADSDLYDDAGLPR
ncbi:type II toxin-antitoxin system VapB family antitoxin [Ruania zhangjianzhongii]|uniref:type II toxin-antitoxin system VapB family antitoxin n=1 Tax=Ruania zhangjianzhongii TaxID=2603206 RepID=UPI0011C98D2B|nr:type II toxin-antitoxin system VapB family antitoxin [Ruania zhangjianzhongii]